VARAPASPQEKRIWRACWLIFLYRYAVVTLVDLPPQLIYGVAIVLGLVLGSFLNVVIYRVPRELSLLWPGSTCPNCGKLIAAYDNVPVLSWLMLRGCARCCGTRISVRYPLIEALAGLYAWAIVQTMVAQLPLATPWWRLSLLLLLHLMLGLGLIAAAFIDMQFMLLPDAITVGGALLGLCTAALRPEVSVLGSLIGAMVGFLGIWLPFDVIYRRVRGRVGMGLGDAKLVMLAGAWFGWQGAAFALLAGAVQGTMAMVAVVIAQGRLDEPEAVTEERRQRLAQIESTQSPEERERLLRELAADPVLAQPQPTRLATARFAFGPFLALGTIEFQLLSGTGWYRDWINSLILP
jgi:leader peptidase (prepilin peptidase)/N-methyltransferase